MYSLDEEVQLGGQLLQAEMIGELKKEQAPVNQDAARVALVREITANIAAVAHVTNLPYKATYVGDPEIVNAYALPGGNVMVFEGIWDPKEGLVKTVDELAAVVAHEIAHVNCRHSTEAMTREMLPNLLLAGGHDLGLGQGRRRPAAPVRRAHARAQRTDRHQIFPAGRARGRPRRHDVHGQGRLRSRRRAPRLGAPRRRQRQPVQEGAQHLLHPSARLRCGRRNFASICPRPRRSTNRPGQARRFSKLADLPPSATPKQPRKKSGS